MFPSTSSQKLAPSRGRAVPGLVGLPGIPQDPFTLGSSIQPVGGRVLQVDRAAKGLNWLYIQLKPGWDELKGSVDTLLNDLEYLVPKYFKETGQLEKASVTPSAEDVINSFKQFGTNDWIGRPLHQFVNLLDSFKHVLPLVKQIKDILSHSDFQKSLTKSLKNIEDFADGKKIYDKIHPEVSKITKKSKLVKVGIYLPLISTVPYLLDNINTVQENLKIELSSIGTRNVDDLLSVPIMLQTAAAPLGLSEADGRAVPGLVGLPGIPQDPFTLGSSIQPVGGRVLQVDRAAKGLNWLYIQLKPGWDELKGSVDTLLNDLEYLVPKYFKETGQLEKASVTPSAEDVINSFKQFGTNDWIGRPLHQFVNLLDSFKHVLPLVKQIKDILSHSDFQKSLTKSLKNIEDFADGKKVYDKIHPEVSKITKKSKLVKVGIYLPLISTVPYLLDNINTVQENLKIELSSIGTRNVDDLLSVPIMLQTAAAPLGLSEADAQAISMYRALIRGLEQDRQLLLQENQHLKTKMLLDQFQIQQNLYPDGDIGLGLGLLDHDVRHGTALEKMLRMFHQKVSMCKLKDVSQINFTTSIFSAGIFDSKGGNLTINDAGVNLFIPPGAIPCGTRKEIYIYLDGDAHLKLENKKETRIAPIIHCGPPGTSFEAPFVLSFPHCAEDEEKWTFSGLIKDSNDSDANWQHIDDDYDGISLVQGGHCIILVDHFTNITATGIAQMEGSKRMNICTFGKCYNRNPSYTFNVRAFNTYDTNTVMKEQGKLKEECLDAVKTLRVQNTGKDVKINLNNLKKGWKSEYEDQMTLKHDELWYEKDDGCRSPFCRFRLETENHQGHDSVYCRMKVKQDGNTEETFLEMDSAASPTRQGGEVQLGDIPVNINIHARRRIFGPMNDCYEKLPQDVCNKVCSHIGEERPGTLLDWRGLADKFGFESDVIEKIRKKKNPTMYLLNILSTRYKTRNDFCRDLHDKLREAGLTVVADWVKPFVTL